MKKIIVTTFTILVYMTSTCYAGAAAVPVSATLAPKFRETALVKYEPSLSAAREAYDEAGKALQRGDTEGAYFFLLFAHHAFDEYYRQHLPIELFSHRAALRAFEQELAGRTVAAAQQLCAQRFIFEALKLLDMNRAYRVMADVDRVKATALNRQIFDMIVVFAHDIRTPLNALVGFTSLLTDQEERYTIATAFPESASLLHAIKVKANALQKSIETFSDILSQIHNQQSPFLPDSAFFIDVVRNYSHLKRAFMALDGIVQQHPDAIDADSYHFLDILRNAVIDFGLILQEFLNPYLVQSGVSLPAPDPVIDLVDLQIPTRLKTFANKERNWSRIEETKTDIPCDLPPVAIAQEAFVRVLNNLLNNAVIHGASEDRRVRIEIAAARVPGGVKVTVRDNGTPIPEAKLSLERVSEKGMPARYVQKLFLSRGETTGKAGESFGIGLSSVYDALSKYGASIHAENKDGWATFSINLPLAVEDTLVLEGARRIMGSA